MLVGVVDALFIEWTMKKYAIYLVGLLFCGLGACSNNPKKSLYEKAYEENFSKLMATLEYEPDIRDTLYVEMYIALKACTEEDNSPGDTVLDRVDKLLELDSNAENQRHYLEAASLVYGMRKDYDNYWELNLKKYDTYPQNSFERLSSLAAYYKLQMKNGDSASYYIMAEHKVANQLLESDNHEDKKGAYMGKVFLYILEGKDEEAKAVLRHVIETENDIQLVKEFQHMLDAFSNFKAEIFAMYT